MYSPMLLLFLLLPIAAVAGWYVGYKYKSSTRKAGSLSRDYFVGLKYLIDEQPDKAIDVFIKMLDVNSDTVETHLALGGLFRRRGEVDRAIRVHQNLIARPQLEKEQRINTLFELAQDYMSAGVLNRAEKLFLELIQLGGNTTASYLSLLNIYEQQKDWEQAIAIADKLASISNVEVQTRIAHYYCELNNFKKALLIDKNCVRASLLQGEAAMKDSDLKDAIRAYKKVIEQNPDYISEIIAPLAQCYEQLNNEAEFISYLHHCLAKYPRISIILALAEFIRKHKSDFAAIEFTVPHMQHYPSLRGISYLTELYVNNASENTKKKLLLLQEFMQQLLENKPIYRCIHCGFSSKTLYWQCPGCHEWSSIKPIHGLEGD